MRAADTQVIELARLRTQTRFDVAQALAIGQLRKRQAQILIEAGESLDLVLARRSARRSDETSCSGRCCMICANTSLPMFISATRE